MHLYKKCLLITGIIALPILGLLFIVVVSIANMDPSSSGVIILETLKSRNELIFHPFDIYSIDFYYVESLGKKENNHVTSKEIKGKVIIKEFDDTTILYESRFVVSLMKKGKVDINGSLCNVVSHQYPFIEFYRNSDFFFKSWNIVQADDLKKIIHFYPNKKYKIIIEFDQPPPLNSFLYAGILGDIRCDVKKQFENITERK